MSAPKLTTKIEPAEASSVVYGALAAKTSNDPSQGQLSLVLTITNNESSPVHLTQVTVSFLGPPSVSPSSIPADLTIPSMQTEQWYFAPANNIILPVAAPGTVQLTLTCDGFSDPAELDAPLTQYVSPADGGGYAFPARTGDLKKAEFWTGRSAVHGAAGGGMQLFAYDLVVRAFDAATNGWPTARPGADNTKNASYHIWGKPIYAMAGGVVKQFRDGIAANIPPGLPMPTPNPVEGNHLHIHVDRATIPWGGPPRPLPFNGIYVLDLAVVDPNTWPPNSDTPWSAVSAQGLPGVVSAIWPGSLRLGKKIFRNWFYVLAWAWIIIIGGLMITPGGVDCIKCGPTLTKALGIISIAVGVLGLASYTIAGRMSAKQRTAQPQVDV